VRNNGTVPPVAWGPRAGGALASSSSSTASPPAPSVTRPPPWSPSRRPAAPTARHGTVQASPLAWRHRSGRDRGHRPPRAPRQHRPAAVPAPPPARPPRRPPARSVASPAASRASAGPPSPAPQPTPSSTSWPPT